MFFLTFLTFINAQTKESDYFIFYKGGEKYLKLINPIKTGINNNRRLKISMGSTFNKV